MKLVQVQFAPWDKKYNFDPVDLDLRLGDQVIVKTELGTELGKVVGMIDLPGAVSEKITGQAAAAKPLGANSADISRQKSSEPAQPNASIGVSREKSSQAEIKKVIRKAVAADLERSPDAKQLAKDFSFCKKLIEKYQLPMKLVGVHYSFDDTRVTFPFIAESRVDFRELVKDLTKHFGRVIRLQQIGIRDEARFCGDFGHCGRPLCCGRFLGELNSIVSEMAELQQCAHRGSERISGVCGRLMCCLSFEQDGYEKLAKRLPPLDSEVTVEGKKGRVIARHILKQTVDVRIYENNDEASAVVEVEAAKIKMN